MEDNRKKTETAPVCVILAYDTQFYELLPQLFPHNPDAVNWFAGSAEFAQQTAFRNSSLQGGYLMLAARALGLDVGAMSGFDPAGVDAAFFPDGRFKTNFLCNLGYGDPAGLSRARRVSRLMTHARLSDGDARVMPETVLACDTTQGACSAALWHKGAVVAERLVKMQRGHAEALLPALGEIKREAPDIWAQINVLAVTVGPGTFTGVRVGLSAMRGLSLAMGVPVAGFGTLHMMALASTSPHRRLVAVDARRDTFYTQICSPDGMPCEPPTARSLKACLALGVEDDDPKFTVIGTGTSAICTPENSRFSADLPALAAGRRASRPCRRPHYG